MAHTIDLNADVGEASTPDWAASEAAILRYVSSVNIACGGHAGDAQTMTDTAKAARAKNITIGAHPSYPDRKNFGRLELTLGEDITARDLSESLYEQVCRLMDASQGAVKYVKPHGALYNQAAKTAKLADLFGDIILRVDPRLMWLGAPRSEMARAAQDRDIGYAGEGFIDRQYNDDGQLTPRALDGAVISDHDARMAQAIRLAKDQCVISRNGKTLPLKAGSLCVHGDSAGAVDTARLTRAALEQCGFNIRRFA